MAAPLLMNGQRPEIRENGWIEIEDQALETGPNEVETPFSGKRCQSRRRWEPPVWHVARQSLVDPLGRREARQFVDNVLEILSRPSSRTTRRRPGKLRIHGNGPFVSIGGDRTVSVSKPLKRRRLPGLRRTVCTDHRSCPPRASLGGMRTTATKNTPRVAGAVKMSLQFIGALTKPACIAGVRVSRPNFNARCGRMKL